MPKKSKQQKIISDLRRQSSGMTSTPTFSFSYTHKEVATKPTSTTIDTGELSAIRHDLVKTLILATIAIALELTLYWFGRGRI